jgi:hypothetical protein
MHLTVSHVQDGSKQKVLKMMEAQGYQQGQGLGKALQGMLDPITKTSQQQRAGLGYGANGAAVHADWSMLPDIVPYTNPDLVWEAEEPGEEAVVPVGPDSDVLTYAWQHEQAPCLPPDVLNSKVLHVQVFLDLKEARRRARELLVGRTTAHTSASFCQHRGAVLCFCFFVHAC